MAERISRAMLEKRVKQLSEKTGLNFVLDHAAGYGGYRLQVTYNYVPMYEINRSRVNANTMYCMINAMLEILDLDNIKQHVERAIRSYENQKERQSW